jgi:hypothetical protein
MEELYLENNFNQPIEPGFFPNRLKYLKFSNHFNQSIKPNVLPDGLKTLHFGGYFNQIIEPGVLPESLEILVLGEKFNQPIEPGILPNGLKYFFLGYNFNYPLNLLPSSLKIIDIASSYSSRRARKLKSYSYDIIVPNNCIIVDNDEQFEELYYMKYFDEIESFLTEMNNNRNFDDFPHYGC